MGASARCFATIRPLNRFIKVSIIKVISIGLKSESKIKSKEPAHFFSVWDGGEGGAL